MKKQITAALLTGVMLMAGIPSFAEETVGTQSEAAPAIMTIDGAIAYALEHSPAIASANSAIDNKRYSLTQARYTQDALRKSEMPASSLDDGLMMNDYFLIAAQTQLEIARRNLLAAQNTLTTKVKSDFYTYLSTKDKAEIARTNLISAQEKLNSAKVNKDNGAISALDYTSFELAAKEAQNAVNQAERAVDLAELQVKFTINYPQENKLILQGEFKSPSITMKDSDTAAALSKNHVNYLTLQDTFMLAEKRWQYAQGWYSPAQPGYSMEKAVYESAQADYQKNTNDLEMNIRSLYNNLQTIQENTQYMQESVALLLRRTDAAKLQYEMGMITANNLIDTQQQYFNAQNQLKDLELSYLITALQYRAMYTYEDDGSIQ